MSIIRTNKTEKYFVASNELFNDNLISWEARGLMAYLLSKPNHWRVRIDDLLAQSPAGITKLRSILSELEQNGYIKRSRIKNDDGTFDWVTDVYESSIGRFSVDGKHDDIVSTDLVNTESNTASGENQPSATLPIEWQIVSGAKTIVMPDEKEQQYMDAANLLCMGSKLDRPIAYGIAYVFMRTRGIVIPEGKIKGNRKVLKSMVNAGVLPTHAEQATRKLMESGMTVVDLFSIEKTAIDLANPATPQNSSHIETRD